MKKTMKEKMKCNGTHLKVRIIINIVTKLYLRISSILPEKKNQQLQD